MARRKATQEFPGYFQVREPDLMELGSQIKKAMGERTLAKFAEETEVSASTLSRLINGKFPSASSHSVIASIVKHIDPNSGVTKEDILKALGLEHSPLHIIPISDLDEGTGPDDSTTENMLQKETLPITGYYLPKKDNLTKVALTCESIIQRNLLEGGFSIFRTKKSPHLHTLGYYKKSAFAIETDALKKHGIRRWEFLYVDSGNNRHRKILFSVLGLAYCQSLKKQGIKVSILCSSKAEYKELKKRTDSLSIKDDISIILINVSKGSIVDEFQIPMKKEGNYKSVLLNYET